MNKSPTNVLNSKQLRFIDEYLIDFNATQAAIRAGYSKKTASEQSFALLRKLQIQTAIQAKQKELASRAGITRERIISEIARIAFSDVRKLFNEAGALKPIHQLDDDTAGALAGMDARLYYPIAASAPTLKIIGLLPPMKAVNTRYLAHCKGGKMT